MHWIQSGGYWAVFLAMTLESACIPLPSEIIMPFGGFLAQTRHTPLLIVALSGTAGNIVGSLIAYWVGKYGGRTLILRYGRYLHVTERHLQHAERWFDKWGEWSVFIGRLLPGIRTFISLPAGIVRMPILKFTLLTAMGSLIWSTALGYAGYQLGQNWNHIQPFIHPLLYVAVALVVIIAGMGIYRGWIHSR